MVLRSSHLGNDPKTFNPLIANDSTSSSYASRLFMGLVEHDPDTYEVIPSLAKSFEIFDDGKTIIVELRKDIFWSDGEAITVDDVLFTWNTLLKDKIAISSLRDILSVDGDFPEVRKISNAKVSFSTKKVFAPFLSYLSTVILPKHDIERFFIEKNASSFAEKQKAFNSYLDVYTKPSKIVSSGAFLLHELISGERIIMKKNPRFFIKDSEGNALPYVDKIVFTYSQDLGSAIFRFLADESYSLGVSPSNVALMKSLEKKYNYTLYEMGPSQGTNFFWFNLSTNVPQPKYSWFNNENFRLAMSYAIDREAMVANVFQGMADPLHTAEPAVSPFYNAKLAHYKQDIDYAKKLLEQEKFILKDGILYDKKNNKVEFDLFTNSGNKERELIAVIVKDNLAKLGIKVNVKVLEFNNFVGKLMQGKDYDSGVIGLTGGLEPNDGANVWKSDGRLHLFDVKSSQKNPITRSWEKEIDVLFDKGVQSLDFAQRKQIYDKFQSIIYEHNPLIYLASPQSFTMVKNKLENVRKTKYSGVIPYLYQVKVKI